MTTSEELNRLATVPYFATHYALLRQAAAEIEALHKENAELKAQVRKITGCAAELEVDLRRTRAQVAELEALHKENADLKAKCLAWATGVEQSNTDIVDMQRDEFKRIIALLHPNKNALAAEVVGICERAIACIEQTVPVVVQRDQLRAQVAELQRDKERLDWLQQRSSDDCGGWIARNSKTGRGYRLHETTLTPNFKDVRSAIDAVMQEAKS